jgi:hypothetical protein
MLEGLFENTSYSEIDGDTFVHFRGLFRKNDGAWEKIDDNADLSSGEKLFAGFSGWGANIISHGYFDTAGGEYFEWEKRGITAVPVEQLTSLHEEAEMEAARWAQDEEQKRDSMSVLVRAGSSPELSPITESPNYKSLAQLAELAGVIKYGMAKLVSQVDEADYAAAAKKEVRPALKNDDDQIKLEQR